MTAAGDSGGYRIPSRPPVKVPTFLRSETFLYLGIILALLGFVVATGFAIDAIGDARCNQRLESSRQRIEECRSSGRSWHETDIGMCGDDVLIAEGECWDR